MSSHELRNLTGMLRALGYRRPVSTESFRKPNFELVADMLFWMVKKFDPSARVRKVIDTKNDRIEFLTQVVDEMQTKARIRLNPNKLYAADEFAIMELLRLARVVCQAFRIDVSQPEWEAENDHSVSGKSRSRVKDSKPTRQAGAKLHEQFNTKLNVRERKQHASDHNAGRNKVPSDRQRVSNGGSQRAATATNGKSRSAATARRDPARERKQHASSNSSGHKKAPSNTQRASNGGSQRAATTTNGKSGAVRQYTASNGVKEVEKTEYVYKKSEVHYKRDQSGSEADSSSENESGSGSGGGSDDDGSESDAGSSNEDGSGGSDDNNDDSEDGSGSEASFSGEGDSDSGGGSDDNNDDSDDGSESDGGSGSGGDSDDDDGY